MRILLLFLFSCVSAFAKQIEFDEREVSIAIKYELTDPKNGPNPTFLRFPRAVSRIDNATKFFVKSASPPGADADFREVEIRPRFNDGVQKVEVLLNDGSVVRLRIKITEDPKTPTSYDFEPKRTLDEKKESQGTREIADLSVMRAVLQEEVPAGMGKHWGGSEISCRGSGVSARVKQTFDNEQFKVFQIRITNDSRSKEFRFHEENIILRGQDMAMSPLYHVTNRALQPSGKGKSEAMLTILSSSKVLISKASICDVGDQIELIQSETKPRKK
jgi:hypothetical protein